MAAIESATILFTDLMVADDSLSSSAPEATDEMRRLHFAALRKAIARAGGTEVKNLGNGLMVAFSAASTALSCAVAMQQAAESEARRSGGGPGLRIGISAGEAASEDGDYFGDPVIEAARLCARADEGQILAARIVQVLAGRRATHAFRKIGPLELKGLAEPVETLEVGWEPLREEEAPESSEIPLPARLGRRPTTGIIGRETEREALQDAYKRAAANEGRQVVLISGEAGQGKTTLAAEAAQRAHDAGAIALLGRCDEELGVPYGPFVEALQQYVVGAPERVLQSHVATHGSELVRLTRALASRVEGLPAPRGGDAETERYLLYGAVVDLLSQASQEQPLVLVLDDLQWADAASLQLLRHLVKETDPLQLLVVCTYRDAELSSSHPLLETLATLRREPRVHRIVLQGLDDLQVVQFMEAAAGHDLSDEGVHLAHAVYTETDGNPFFVSEMWRHLAESGAIEQDDSGHWLTHELPEASLPTSVREVVTARVSRLGKETSRILSLASVIGRQFDLEHLGLASQVDEDHLIDLLEAAESAALIREVRDVPGRYSFCHALVQHTLYQEMGVTRRARAHRQVAEALEELCGGRPGQRVGELAHHWFNATQQVDVQKAISYSRQAAELALESLAPLDAIGYFVQAIQLLDHWPDAGADLVIDLQLGLGVAQRQAGIPAFRETLLEAARLARQSGDRERLVQAALHNNRGFFSSLGVVDDERVDVLEAALRAVPDDSPARAVLLATLCTELAYGPLERRLELAQEARSIARRTGDPATQIDVSNLQQLPLNVPETLPIRLHSTAKSVILARDLDDPARLFWSVCADRSNTIQTAQPERSTRHLAVARSLAERFRQPMMMWVVAYHEAADALVRGESERAEELATQALEIGTESGQPDAFAFYGAQIIIVRLQQGRLHELTPLIVEGAEQNPNIAAYHASAAAAHLDAGDESTALGLLERASADGFVHVPRDTAWFDAIALYARVAIELRAAGPSESLVELLEPYPNQVPCQCLTAHEPTACMLGGLLSVLGRYDEAEQQLEKALRMSGRAHMRYGEAQTRLAWGRMLSGKLGDRARSDGSAERWLLESLDIARSSSYGAIERRALGALDHLHGRG